MDVECKKCADLAEALESATWHLKVIASDIENPGQRAITDRWIAEAQGALAKARGEA